ncbi:MAG: hypothetical protein KDA27_23085 [Candidatus Eisenbacteria bacterium]|uniref:Restriction endonuclease n=1 Tax=Eiseniibacteriota bacterium TaxID=2212470 RepID=A0A956NH14_UNCEI|nr:hypothetical protein [Candidatus Eisenbacteria bacterium]
MTDDERRIRTIRDVFDAAGDIPMPAAKQTEKKNYAERFSRHMATCVANGLRKSFPTILPNEDGSRQESPARTAKGFKKLDVNFSTPELGLALGVSIKSIHFADAKTKRFTKNYSRNDNELRAEATDYHQRQPYSVLVGVLFLPAVACDDGGRDASSFGAAVKYFRNRAGRTNPHDDPDRFERFFIAVFDLDRSTCFFDVEKAPPKSGRPLPEECLDFEGFLAEVVRAYDTRNDPPFEWARE